MRGEHAENAWLDAQTRQRVETCATNPTIAPSDMPDLCYTRTWICSLRLERKPTLAYRRRFVSHSTASNLIPSSCRKLRTTLAAPQSEYLFDDVAYRLLLADSPRAYRICFAVLVVLVVATMLLLCLGGAAPQTDGGYDAVIFLDTGWRIFCGQRPHTDFYNYFGITSYLPVLIGLALRGCDCAAFAYGAAALLPAVTLAAWHVARPRFPALPAAWLAATVGGLVVGTFPSAAPRTTRWADSGTGDS